MKTVEMFIRSAVPQEFGGCFLWWGFIFQATFQFWRRAKNLLLVNPGVSVSVSIGAWLPTIGGRVKTSAVVGMKGLLQLRASSALLTGLTELGTGLAQVP